MLPGRLFGHRNVSLDRTLRANLLVASTLSDAASTIIAAPAGWRALRFVAASRLGERSVATAISVAGIRRTPQPGCGDGSSDAGQLRALRGDAREGRLIAGRGGNLRS